MNFSRENKSFTQKRRKIPEDQNESTKAKRHLPVFEITGRKNLACRGGIKKKKTVICRQLAVNALAPKADLLFILLCWKS
jgi:hypothetical protein